MTADYPHSATLQVQAYEDGPMLVVQTCLTCGNTVFINMVVAGLCEGVE